jgi:hypothetical protein
MQRNRTTSMASADRPLHPVKLPAGWAPASWLTHPVTQLPAYPDADALA